MIFDLAVQPQNLKKIIKKRLCKNDICTTPSAGQKT
jgi:hypothetical protein